MGAEDIEQELEESSSEKQRRRRVLVTGAGGYIGEMLLPGLAERYDLRLLDTRDLSEEAGFDVVEADLTSSDRSAYAQAFEGIDTVVHLAYVRSSPGGVYDPTVPHLDRFEDELANVRMAYNVYRCALEAGVQRVVVASSNHAADWYEHALIHTGQRELVGPEDLPLSDNFYGWSKASYELLAYPFACGIFGRKLEVVMVRIGAPREVDPQDHIDRPKSAQPSLPSGTAGLKRDLGAYLSVTDAQRIFEASIETEDIENEHGVPWLVVYGISGNTRAFWSLESARGVLGYEPEDDSEVRFAEHVNRWLTGPEATAAKGKLG